MGIYISYAIALLVSTIGACTDIKFGRVKNKYLLVALLAWVANVIYTTITTRAFSMFSPVYASNFVFAVAITLILYLKDIWAPGDAKLFLTVVLIYPVDCYIAGEGNVFPALNILIYSFALGYIWLLLILAYRKVFGTTVRIVNIGQDDRKDFKGFLISLAINMGIVIGINTTLRTFWLSFVQQNQMLCTLAIVGLTYLISEKFSSIRTALGIIGWIVYVAILILQPISYTAVILGLVENVIIAIAISYLNRELKRNSYRVITGDEVKPGMILSLSTVWAMQKCIDPDIPRKTTENRRTRITVKQAEAVRNWAKITKRDISIVEMLPFAPFIAAAVVVEFVRYLIFYVI